MGIQADVDRAMETLRKTCTLDKINDVLAGMFNDAFTMSGYPADFRIAPGLYTMAVRETFYSTRSQILPPAYRECAVLALLASQGADANLAFHVFIALAAGIAADDVVDVLFLAGIYCGANLLTKSLRVATKTFQAIVQAEQEGRTEPADVFRKIGEAFPDPASLAAKPRCS